MLSQRFFAMQILKTLHRIPAERQPQSDMSVEDVRDMFDVTAW